MTKQERALEYAKNHSQAPDKETPDWIVTDFLAGWDACEKQLTEEKKKLEQEVERLRFLLIDFSIIRQINDFPSDRKRLDWVIEKANEYSTLKPEETQEDNL